MKKRLFAALLLWLITYVSTAAQTVINMRKVGAVYEVPCTINGLPLKFIFDTGASDVSLSLTEARFMLKNGYLSKGDLLGTTSYNLANGEVAEGTEILLRSIEIGGIKLSRVRASIIHNLNAPLLLGQSALAMLGKVSIDYNANTLTIPERSGDSDRVATATNNPKPAKPKTTRKNVSDAPVFGMAAWVLTSRPDVNDDSDETGKIVFQIRVNESGEVTNVRQLQSTVSPPVSELYRRAVGRLRLRPKGGVTPPSSTTGTITFTIRSREE